jgi:hypothetical protein
MSVSNSDCGVVNDWLIMKNGLEKFVEEIGRGTVLGYWPEIKTEHL